MPEAAPAPVTPPAAQPAEAVEAKPPEAPKVDPRAELNERVKAAGIKLKAKDREVSVNSIDDLVGRANRVFGVESLLEEAKATKSEAEAVKSWRAAVESDDDALAEEAFDALSAKGQRNALKWLQKKHAKAEEEESLSPREKELRHALEASERQRREYEARDAKTRQEREEQQAQAEMTRTREMAAGMAMKALEALKAPKELAPMLLPRVARVLRVAMQGGVEMSPDEVASEVRDSVLAEQRQLIAGMDAEGLVSVFGEEISKKLVKHYLAKRKQVAPGQPVQTQQTQQTQPEAQRGTPRFFR